MACCGGKKTVSGPEIQTEMKEIKVEKFDELFTEGSEALQNAENFRAAMTDSKATCMAISGAYTLKVGGMSDALKCFMWSVCQEVGADKFANMKPTIDIEAENPFSMELDPAMSAQNTEFFEAFKLWVEHVAGSADSIQILTEKLKGVSEKAQELAGTAKDECSNAGLNAIDTTKAVAAIGSNSKTLATGITKLGGLASVGQEALTDIKELAGALAGILEEGAKNSDEGKEKGAKTAAEYCEKQHTGEKLDAKQSAADSYIVTYNKNKESGKKLSSVTAATAKSSVKPSVKQSVGVALELAEAEGEEAAPADVNPELKDV